MQIKTSTGTREISVRHFPAFEGYDIQHRFLEFAASNDKMLRRDYLMEVMAYASVQIEGSDPIALTTSALIDNHVETWQNIELIFNSVLQFNGIDPEQHANKPRFWADAGTQMAIAFLAQCTSLIGPAIEAAANLKPEDAQG